MMVGPVIGPLHHQWSVLVCNATNNNDLHFSMVKIFGFVYATPGMPPLQVQAARQSMHNTGTLLVLYNYFS